MVHQTENLVLGFLSFIKAVAWIQGQKSTPLLTSTEILFKNENPETEILAQSLDVVCLKTGKTQVIENKYSVTWI